MFFTMQRGGYAPETSDRVREASSHRQDASMGRKGNPFKLHREIPSDKMTRDTMAVGDAGKCMYSNAHDADV